MQKQINAVKEFHTAFVIGHSEIPRADLGESKNILRYNLMKEENEEYLEAVQNNDLVEIADALCDLQYVLSGAVLEFGLGEKFVDLFNEVQRSNMSKACQSLEEAEYTVKFYQDKDGTEAEIKEEHGVWKVFRKSDNKVLKSINYSPADLVSILK